MKTFVISLSFAALAGSAFAQEAVSSDELEPERINSALPDVYEASVELEAGLSAFPVVQSAVRAEETTLIASFADLAVQDHAAWVSDAPEWSWNGYFQDVTVEIAFAGAGAISLIRRASYYTGGAHPNQSVDAVLTLEDAYAPVSLGDLLTDTSDESQALTGLFYALYRELMAIKQERLGEGFDERVERDTWLSSLAAELDAFPSFSLLPNEAGDAAAGLVFHFEPYEVGSYAEGGYDVPVPLAVFEAYLTEDWQSVFAGQPAQTILTETGDEREPQNPAETEN